MTCCGFVTSGGAGYLWGDGEQYLNGRPMKHPIDKVAVSAGGLAAVSTGLSSLTAEVRRLVAGLGLATFSDAIRASPRFCAGPAPKRTRTAVRSALATRSPSHAG